MIEHIIPSKLNQWLQIPDLNLLILDVREPWELVICVIEPYDALVLNELLVIKTIDDLPIDLTDKFVVTVCHHGRRSLVAAYHLLTLGLSSVFNLHGGVHEWAKVVDTTMRTY